MKPDDISWPEYFQQGIAYMEGLNPSGVRDYEQAATIFEECTDRLNDLSGRIGGLSIEAFFRRGQVAHYQQQLDLARKWINLGRTALTGSSPGMLSADQEAQCLLIEGIVWEADRDFTGASSRYLSLWQMNLSNQRLRGDVANRLARFALRRVEDDLGYYDCGTQLQEACDWIRRAEECYENIQRYDPLVLHALTAVKMRAALLFTQRVPYLWQDANNLFRHSAVYDRHLRATYWRTRCQVAWHLLQPLRAAWFGTRYLWAKMKL